MAAAALLRLLAKVLPPHVGRVFAFTAVPGDARAHAADHRRIDGSPGDNHLALGERGQVVKQVASHAFNGSGHAFLVDFVHDTHDTLRLALAQHVGIELAGTLTD